VLIVAGDGSQRSELEALVGNAGARVVFTGHVDDVAGLLQAADVFVLPSRADAREGSPLSILQASAMGLPVLVTDDANVHLTTPWVQVVPGDRVAFDRALHDAVVSQEFPQAASERELERFHIETWSAAHLELFAAVANPHKTKDP